MKIKVTQEDIILGKEYEMNCYHCALGRAARRHGFDKLSALSKTMGWGFQKGAKYFELPKEVEVWHELFLGGDPVGPIEFELPEESWTY